MQAESLWLHLPIITELASMCHRVFAGGSIQYAYTTIPTYPRYHVYTALHRGTGCDADRGPDQATRLMYLQCTCSGQIGFMICSKKSAEEPLDTRVPRQPAPARKDFPALRQVAARLSLRRVADVYVVIKGRRRTVCTRFIVIAVGVVAGTTAQSFTAHPLCFRHLPRRHSQTA